MTTPDETSRARETRLEILRAFRLVRDDPARFLRVVLGCADDHQARTTVADEYGVSHTAAVAMLDMPFGRLTGRATQQMDEELAHLESETS